MASRRSASSTVVAEEHFTVLPLEQSFVDAVVEEAEELVVEAIDVEQKDGLLVELEGVPGEDFEEFFEGSEAPGERNECISSLTHEGFAGVHGVGDVQLGDALVGDFQIDQNFRNDADDFAAGGQGCFCCGAHEADLGSAVDEADVVLGESASESFGCGTIAWVRSISGGTEDSDVAWRSYRWRHRCFDYPPPLKWSVSRW